MALRKNPSPKTRVAFLGGLRILHCFIGFWVSGLAFRV